MTVRVAAGAVGWIAAAVGYFALEAMAAAAFEPSYSYATDYISSLGVPSRSARAAVMNAAFCWQGTGFLLGAVLTGPMVGHRRWRWCFVFLAGANAVGNILVAVVHSGSGNWVHGLGALLAIAGGNAAIVAGAPGLAKSIGARWYRGVAWLLAGLGFVGLALFALGANYVGFWERISVYSILLWQTLTGVLLLHALRTAAFRGPDR